MIGIEEARTRFSSLVREAEEGREIVITVYGKPRARLVAYEPPAPEGGISDALAELREARASLDEIRPLLERLAEKP